MVEIKEIQISKNLVYQKNKRFVFISLETTEQAKHALIELKNTQMRENHCRVMPGKDNDSLYSGNICKTWTKDIVREKLKEYRIDNIEEMALMDDWKNDEKNLKLWFWILRVYYSSIGYKCVHTSGKLRCIRL